MIVIINEVDIQVLQLVARLVDTEMDGIDDGFIVPRYDTEDSFVFSRRFCILR